jgi:hypothetical protein
MANHFLCQVHLLGENIKEDDGLKDHGHSAFRCHEICLKRPSPALVLLQVLTVCRIELPDIMAHLPNIWISSAGVAKSRSSLAWSGAAELDES